MLATFLHCAHPERHRGASLRFVILASFASFKHVLKQIVAKRHASVRISSSRESQSPQSSRRWRSTDLLHPCEQMVIQCRDAKIMIRNGGIGVSCCSDLYIPEYCLWDRTATLHMDRLSVDRMFATPWLRLHRNSL